jgi:hypothetical protein
VVGGETRWMPTGMLDDVCGAIIHTMRGSVSRVEQGADYQTRMNAVLRSFMEHEVEAA